MIIQFLSMHYVTVTAIISIFVYIDTTCSLTRYYLFNITD